MHCIQTPADISKLETVNYRQKSDILSNRSVDIRTIYFIEVETVQKDGRYVKKPDIRWKLSSFYPFVGPFLI